MPTGYTSRIKDGQTFEEYALGCARAFGALVIMRDDNMDAPIPEEFSPSQWHIDERAKDTAEHSRISNMTEEEAEAKSILAYATSHEQIEKRILEDRELMSRYRAMRSEAVKWEPPTTKHTKLKEFMLSQLDSSIEHDSMEDYYRRNPAIALTGVEWRDRRIEELNRSIVYHTTEYEKELERNNDRNAWVKALRDSLVTVES